MVFLLYGPDTYSKSKKVEELRAFSSSRNPLLTLRSFGLDDEQQLYALHEFCVVQGLFPGGKRFALVRYADTFFDNELFLQLISRIAHDPDVVLLISSDREKKFEKKHELFWKAAGARIQFFGKLTDMEIQKKTAEFAATIPVRIDQRAIRFLNNVHIGCLYAITSDIHKWSAITDVIDVPFLMNTGEYAPITELFSIARSMLYPKGIAHKLSFFEHALFQRTDLYAIFNIVAKMTSAGDLITALAQADLCIKNGLLDIQQAMTKFILIYDR